MSQYKLIMVFTDPRVSTCQHCGRAIKNVVIIENTVTNERLEVGTTCFGKIMNLNEKFDKAIQSEIRKYKKDVEFYRSRIDINLLEKIEENLKQNASLEEDHYSKMKSWKVVRDTIKDIEFSIYQLIQKTEKLENMSKKGLIKLENLDKLNEELKEFKNRFKTTEKGNEWNYILDNELKISELLNKYE